MTQLGYFWLQMYSKLHSLRTRFIEALKGLYDDREADNLFFLVLQVRTGIDKLSYHARTSELQADQLAELESVLQELQSGKPVQYILGSCTFHGLQMSVDTNTLIPRPETEELVEWMLSDLKEMQSPVIWDIGTGSGCIAIALAYGLPNAQVHASDISEGVIGIAGNNAKFNGVRKLVRFHKHDILNGSREQFNGVDVIVSNPPYIPQREIGEMHETVVDHEPHLALFVPDEDPLLFYRKIVETGSELLPVQGLMYFEIHENLAQGVADLFDQAHWETSLRSDMQGKERMLKARKIS